MNLKEVCHHEWYWNIFCLSRWDPYLFLPLRFLLFTGYVTHLTGGKIEHAKMQVNQTKLYFRSIAFITGFSMIFITLEASASLIGKILMDYRIVISNSLKTIRVVNKYLSKLAFVNGMIIVWLCLVFLS